MILLILFDLNLHIINLEINNIVTPDPPNPLDSTNLKIADLQDEEEEDTSSDPTFFVCCIFVFIFVIVIVVITLYRYNQRNLSKSPPLTNPNYPQQSQTGNWLDYQSTGFNQQQAQQQNYQQSFPSQQAQQYVEPTNHDSTRTINDYQIISDEISSKSDTKQEIQEETKKVDTNNAIKQPVAKKEQQYEVSEIKPDPTYVEEFSSDDELLIDWELPKKPEDLTESELNKLRMKDEDLNQRLYSLETEKAMGKLSTNDFNTKKNEIVRDFINQYHK